MQIAEHPARSPLTDRIKPLSCVFSEGCEDEQCRRGLHGAQARVRSVFQPLVRREVPERRPQRRPMQRAVPQIPHVCSESHQGEGHPYRRCGVHGPEQRETRQLMA